MVGQKLGDLIVLYLRGKQSPCFISDQLPKQRGGNASSFLSCPLSAI